MSKHPHTEMIKAKADNMELVVFCKGINDGCEWHEIKRFPNWQDNASYFLCLPKHKEACLHWLNGWLIECNSNLTNGWEGCASYNECFWKLDCGMMREDANYRIKPHKEKRWIGVNPETGVTTNLRKSRDELVKLIEGYDNYQFIEIEVEV